MSIVGTPTTGTLTAAQQKAAFQMAAGLFGMSLGTTYLTQVANSVIASTAADPILALYESVLNSQVANQFGYFSFQTSAQFTTNLLSKLLPAGTSTTSTLYTTAKSAIDNLFAAGQSKAQVAKTAIDYLAALSTTDATFGAVAAQLANRVTVSEYYTLTKLASTTDLSVLSGTITNVTSTTNVSTSAAIDSVLAAAPSQASTGQTYTLTSSIDSITGTTNADTVIGDAATLSAADQIDVGAGADTFKLVMDSTSGDETVTFKNGEILLVTDSENNTKVVDVTNSTSLTQVGFVNNSQDGSIANVTVSGVTVSVEGGSTSMDAKVTFADSLVSGATDTLNITLTSAKIDDLNVQGHTTGTHGFETVNITATGTGSTSGNQFKQLLSGSTNAATKVTFAGAGDVTVTNALANTTTIDASASTGKIKVTSDTGKNVTFTGGSGDDTIFMATGHDANDTLNGGTGTDTVGISDSTDVDTTAEGSKITNFEVLDIVGSANTNAYDMTYLSGISKITSSGALGANTTITNMTASTNVEVQADIGTYSLTVNKKDANLSASDTLTLTHTASSSITGTGTFDINDIETVTLVAATTASGTITHTIAGLQADEATKLVVNADTTARLTVSSLQAKALVELDASAATKNISLTMAAAIVGGANGGSFTLGAGNDTLDLKAVTDFATATHDTTTTATVQLKGGAGADTFKIDNVVAGETYLFKYAAGDSVSDSTATLGYSTSKTDLITDFITSSTYTATAGMKFTLDTVESATAVSELNNTTGPVFGTTAVTNAFDFLVYHNSTTTDWYVYQDTDGDKLIESGEFAVKLVGATTDFTISEFSVSSGNLVYTSA